MELPTGTGLERTSEAVRPFEEFLLDDEGVESYQISLGGEDNFDPNAPIRSDNQARAFITITEAADPSEVLARIGEEGRDIFGVEGFQAQILSNGPRASCKPLSPEAPRRRTASGLRRPSPRSFRV